MVTHTAEDRGLTGVTEPEVCQCAWKMMRNEQMPAPSPQKEQGSQSRGSRAASKDVRPP